MINTVIEKHIPPEIPNTFFLVSDMLQFIASSGYSYQGNNSSQQTLAENLRQ